MKGTNFKAKKLEHPDRYLAEDALELVIRNASIDSRTIKALRLTCKRIKAAADAQVKDFSISAKGDILDQEPEAVKRSGLLKNITTLEIDLILEASNDGSQNSLRLSLALSLLNLARDVCSKYIKILHVGISGPSHLILSCACLLGSCVWESLEEICMLETTAMPGFLSGMLARHGTLPALKEIVCREPSASDIEALHNSGFVDKLTSLSIEWSSDAYESNRAPATVAAMRNLLHKAIKVEVLSVTSSTFEFFDSENLASLQTLYLKTHVFDDALEREDVDFAPVLARPWTLLEYLDITAAFLKEPDVVRIFEAENTLSVLKTLIITRSLLDIDTVGCLRRPVLENLTLTVCTNGNETITKLTQLMREDASALPSLRKLSVVFHSEDHILSASKALSKFLSSPCMGALERLSIMQAELSRDSANLLSDIAIHCPNLNYLDLRNNKLGRPAVALLHGLGNMGAFPQLEELLILDQDTAAGDINAFNVEYSHMPPLDVQATLLRVWPGLKCF